MTNARGDIPPPLEVVRWADVISEQEAEVAPDTVEEEITRLSLLPGEQVDIDVHRDDGELGGRCSVSDSSVIR
jgi:hypothetical protein